MIEKWIGLTSEERAALRDYLADAASRIRATRHEMDAPSLAMNNLVITMLDHDVLEVSYAMLLLSLLCNYGLQDKAMVLLSELARREGVPLDFDVEAISP